MVALSQVRRLTVEARSDGADKVTRDLMGIADGQRAVAETGAQMVSSEDKVARSTLSMDRQLQRLQGRIDPLFRATRELDSSMRLLDRALAQGSITEAEHARTLGLVQAQYERTAAAAKTRAIMETNARKAVAPVAATMPIAVTPSFQTANMAAQFQDTVVSAFNGMPAMTIGLQQGMQMASIVSTMERPLMGVGAALAALVSPVSLVTIGLTAAAAAALQYFSTWNASADTLEDDLKTQADLVSEIAKRFKGAGEAAQEYARDSANVLTYRGGANEKDLQNNLREQAEDLDAKLRWAVDIFSRGPSGEHALRTTFDRFVESIRAGSPAVLQFRDDLTALKTSGIHDIDAIIKKWLENTDAMADAQAALNRIRNTTWMADPAMGAIADRWRGRENDRYALGANTEAVGMPAPPPMLPQPDPRRSVDFGADEFIAATKAVADAQRALNNVGLTGLPATLAQISARYDEMSKKAGVTADTLTLLRQAQELESEAAIRAATIQPLQDAKMRSDAQARALAVQSASFGQSAETVGYLNEKLALYNQYIAQGVEITPRLSAAIEAQSRAAGQNAAMQDRMNKAQADAINRMDGFRSATKSALGSLLDGDWSSALNSFRDFFLDQFTSQLTQGLLGRQGEAGGGAFGNALMGLFGGGATRGASASNPVYVSFGDGGLSALLGGTAKANGLLPAPMSAANSNALGIIGGTDALSIYRKALAEIESSGNYGALGPLTKSGDRAYGAYQVMGANIPSWTKATFGSSMTPQQFLGNPQAQDAVFNRYFGSYLSKFGNANDAASMWFTGRPLASGAGLADITGTTGSVYVDRFNQALGRATSGLEGFASKATNNGNQLGQGGNYPASLPLTSAQAAMMPAGVSPYGAGWANQQLSGLSGVFEQLTGGLGSLVDSFLPGFGNVLSMLLNGLGSGGGSGLLGLFGGLFGGGWGLSGQAAAFGLYADGGVPPGGLSAYRNTIVNRPTLFAFANGGGLMGEAGGDGEGILPLKRNGRGQLGVYAMMGPSDGNGPSVSLSIGDVHVTVPEGTDPQNAAQVGSAVRQELMKIVDQRIADQSRSGGLLSRSAFK
ncbi:phage tail length tape measure family protein [Pleomorphomonas sp. JP5]|uniref:phage tail length tape measure family protein n=1 Tax=Pleomorphomonas sp. JP5 TaxID=2942998 RepID=UPI002042DED1|nr:phage tail length tape measure family protein [Pleomorphomonas sp. JP5]MCM5556279.1 phage tail length tape measure family protein [Pleomorphomonas sp. JP5]